MSRDALKIMTSSPANALLGAGGGGWNATYHMFQPYPYFSTETHDDFMQTGVETGFPGLLDFLLIWGFFIAAAWSLYRYARPGGLKAATPAVPATTWVILSSALALGIESAMDFNLSLGAVALLLWGLFGLVRGLDRLYGPGAAAKAAAAEAAACPEQAEQGVTTRRMSAPPGGCPSSIKGHHRRRPDDSGLLRGARPDPRHHVRRGGRHCRQGQQRPGRHQQLRAGDQPRLLEHRLPLHAGSILSLPWCSNDEQFTEQ